MKQSPLFPAAAIILTWIIGFAPLKAQNITALKTSTKIQIDGFVNEAVWQKTRVLDDFYQYEPDYGAKVSMKTEVRVVFDAEMIYFAINCFDPEADKITAKCTKRDGDVEDDDAIAIMFDTFNDKNNGYLFIVNPLGTQKEGRIADNGRTTDFTWDETWYSAGVVTDKGWSVEIGIPFKSLKFNSKAVEWGFNAGRRIARRREEGFMAKNLTSRFRPSQFGRLTGLELDKLSRKKYSIIPYVQAEFIDGSKTRKETGLGFRFNPLSNLGLEFTVNPDFATIEADVEKVNLTRFELRYSEKRPFFLEGGENYSTRIRQFYSRRIGEIPWGGKINGKIGKWKINGLATQSDPSTAGLKVVAGEQALYTVFRVNREFGKGSTLGLIGANRSYLDENSGSVGLAATLFFSDVLGMTSQLVRSHGSANTGVWSGFLRPAWDSHFTHFHLRYSQFGEGVKENMNGIGFIRHDDRKEFDTNFSHAFWINKSGLEMIKPDINYNRYWSLAGKLRSYSVYYNIEAAFLKKWKYELSYRNDFKAEYAPYFEKDFKNNRLTHDLEFDNKNGLKINFSFARGINYDSDFEQIEFGAEVKIKKGWNADYSVERYWFSPANPGDNNWIHKFRSSYYFNKDLFVKAFYQTKSSYRGRWWDADYDLLRKTVQLVFVWRFLPPFGSLQLAYQEGTTRHTEIQARARTFFTKLSWVF